jgi:hypothetical protein
LFRSEFPNVTEFTAWNEPNDYAQPTSRRYTTSWGSGGLPGGTPSGGDYGDGAYMAGAYWRVLSEECVAAAQRPGCTVIAGDFTDGKEFSAKNDYPAGTIYADSENYLQHYIDGMGAGASQAPFWAWHSYLDGSSAEKDANQTRKVRNLIRLRSFMSSIPSSAKVFITETGGRASDHRLKDRGKKQDFLTHLSRAAQDEEWLLREIPLLSSRITRVYHYQWNPDPTWDSALKESDGNRRGAFQHFANKACNFTTPYTLAAGLLTSCPAPGAGGVA